MRSLPTLLIVAAALMITSPVIANAQQMIPGHVLPAPVGHFQPRAQGFTTNSAANQIEQDRLSAEDARQQKQDEQLDRKLNICRNC